LPMTTTLPVNESIPLALAVTIVAVSLKKVNVAFVTVDVAGFESSTTALPEENPVTLLFTANPFPETAKPVLPVNVPTTLDILYEPATVLPVIEVAIPLTFDVKLVGPVS